MSEEKRNESEIRRRITYYAFATNPASGRIEQLLVTREHGRQVSQEWTGVMYKTTPAAMADMARLNCGCGR